MGCMRAIDESLWNQEMRLLPDPIHKLVAVHVQTNQHLNISGAYSIRKMIIAVECGVSELQVSDALDTLGKLGLAFYDDATEQIYVPAIPRNSLNNIFKSSDNKTKTIARQYKNLVPSYIADIFHDDIGQRLEIPRRPDYGQIPRPEKIAGPMADSPDLPPPPPPPPIPRQVEINPSPPREKEDPETEIGVLMERYSADQQERICEVWDHIRGTRKQGKISKTIIMAEMRRWAKLDPSRVMHGIEKYIERAYYTENKREEYLYAIMTRATPAEIERGVSCNGEDCPNGVPRVSRTTEQNIRTLQSLWEKAGNGSVE